MQFLRDFSSLQQGSLPAAPRCVRGGKEHCFLKPTWGMGQTWPPSPSGKTYQGTNFHKSKAARQGGLFSTFFKKKTSSSPAKEGWIRERQKEGINLLKINDSDMNFLHLHHMAGKLLRIEKKILLRLNFLLIGTWVRVCSLGAFKHSLLKQMLGCLPVAMTHGSSFHQQFGLLLSGQVCSSLRTLKKIMTC